MTQTWYVPQSSTPRLSNTLLSKPLSGAVVGISIGIVVIIFFLQQFGTGKIRCD